MMREQLLSEAIRGYQFRGKIPFAPDFIRLFRKRYCVEFFYAVSFLCLHKKMYFTMKVPDGSQAADFHVW